MLIFGSFPYVLMTPAATAVRYFRHLRLCLISRFRVDLEEVSFYVDGFSTRALFLPWPFWLVGNVYITLHHAMYVFLPTEFCRIKSAVVGNGSVDVPCLAHVHTILSIYLAFMYILAIYSFRLASFKFSSDFMVLSGDSVRFFPSHLFKLPEWAIWIRLYVLLVAVLSPLPC